MWMEGLGTSAWEVDECFWKRLSGVGVRLKIPVFAVEEGGERSARWRLGESVNICMLDLVSSHRGFRGPDVLDWCFYPARCPDRMI